MSDAGSGSGILRLRRKIPLRVGKCSICILFVFFDGRPNPRRANGCPDTGWKPILLCEQRPKPILADHHQEWARRFEQKLSSLCFLRYLLFNFLCSLLSRQSRLMLWDLGESGARLGNWREQFLNSRVPVLNQIPKSLFRNISSACCVHIRLKDWRSVGKNSFST